MRQLVAAGHLRADAERFGAIVLTESSRGVLRGETPIAFREDPKAPARTLRRASRSIIIEDGDLALWEALRACRQSLADEHNVPAYVIFHDRTLHELLSVRPQTEAEMLSVSGIGQTKLDRYGADFLNVIRDTAVSEA